MAMKAQPIGRLEFVLHVSLISAAIFLVEYLCLNPATQASVLPYYLRQAPIGMMVILLAAHLGNLINGRLLDTGLPGWGKSVGFAIWILATTLPIFSVRAWPTALGLFALLLIAGGSIPGKHQAVHLSSQHSAVYAEWDELTADAKVPVRLCIGQVSFLRALLSFACLGIPVIWVRESIIQPVGPLISTVGIGILYFVWLFKVLGRLADSGRTANFY